MTEKKPNGVGALGAIADVFGGQLGPLLQSFAVQVREYAADAGKACSMPGISASGEVGQCDALTLGVHCEKCSRRVCMGHAFWRMEPKPIPYCPYCVLAMNDDLFSDGGDEDDRDDDDHEYDDGSR